MNHEIMYSEPWEPQPKKKHDQPWERRMTLCMAAIATEDYADRLVMCTDKMVSKVTVSADIEYKQHFIARNWMALFAGTLSDAYELLDMYIKFLDSQPLKWSGGNALESLRKPPLVFKQERVEEYVQSQLGISYDRFLKKGKEEFDPDTHRSVLLGIRRITVDVELAIGGFANGKSASVFTLVGTNLRKEGHFACVGVGATAAEHVLYFRKQSRITSVDQTLYNMWEAKKFGELAPGVSKGSEGTDMMVLEPGFPNHGKHIRVVSRKGKAYLDRQFKRYGPRKVPDDLELSKDVLYRPFGD